MFMSTLSLIAPSLWFIHSIGLAQLQVAQEPTTQRSTVEKPSIEQKKTSAPKVREKKKSRTPASPPAEVNKAATLPIYTQTYTQVTNCQNADGAIADPVCVIMKLQHLYKTARSITAHFSQNYTYAVYKRTQKSSGRLFLKKPGLMRWDYRKPETKVFVSNGDDLWVYEPNKNQAHRKSLRESEIPIAISFLMGEGNLL
ncbi:MAG: outer membrane lipoprotein carrier protein LolA, partial [Bradymonadia bacterium]